MSRTKLSYIKFPKEVWIGWISSFVEAYNMAIYSFLAPLLAPLMFKQAAEGNALLFSYALVLAGSCFMYPLGALYYGWIGDKKGRQRTCLYSTLGLAIATGMMGAIPLHFENLAWMFFFVLLCVQYFFSGGEYQGSIVFSLEHSEERSAGLMSALSSLFAVGGLVAANGMASLPVFLNEERWISISFYLGASGGVVSYFLKFYCKETPVFVNLPENQLKKVNWPLFIKAEWKSILCCVSVMSFFIVSYSFIFIFLPLTHLTEYQEFDTFKSLIVYGLFLVISGWIADRIGISQLMQTGLILFSAVVIPLCFFIQDLIVLQIILTLCACLVIGPLHSWTLHQFKPINRCRGIFLSSAIAFSLFLGSTVPICLIIFEKFASVAICGLYPMLIAIIALSNFVGAKLHKFELKKETT